jgi:hypothetical protein
MAQIREIVDEAERGCGFRKEGGLYLMSGGVMVPCGKLPLPLTVCPCCGEGIKPSRGWTWIGARQLFTPVACTYKAEATGDAAHPTTCECILSGGEATPERTGLLWIGEKFYRTPEDFLREARTLGVSRRIAAVPKDFVVGKTWVLYAHRKAIVEWVPCVDCLGTGGGRGETTKCTTCEGSGKVESWTAAIVGAFLPDRIEYTTTGKETPEELEALEARGLTLVHLTRTADQTEMEWTAQDDADREGVEVEA